jgi:adenosylhomocysteinase
MKSIVKDLKLAPQGARNFEWAFGQMPLMELIKDDFARTKPFKKLGIGMALHVTKETAVLIDVLMAGGAKVAIASCNPLSTQDEMAAFLAKKGAAVFAFKGQNRQEYYHNLNRAVKFLKGRLLSGENRLATIDDGMDLVTLIHQDYPELIDKIIGGAEETTTGVIRLRAMAKDGKLKYPVVAVNDSDTKHLMDNYIGTGQSTIDGILRATSTLIAGKKVVVAGFGDCGKGVARRAQGMGAQIIVTETDPIRALQAHLEGYQVMPMARAASQGDIWKPGHHHW